MIIVPTVPDPQSVTVTSSLGSEVLNGSDVTLTCSVQMNQNLLPAELSLLMVTAQFTRPDGLAFNLPISSLVMSGTTYNFTTEVSSFGDDDVGSYTCTATIGLRPSSTSLGVFLTGMGQLVSNPITIVIGK